MNMLRAGIIATRVDMAQQLFPGVAAAALFIAKGIVMDLWSGLPITTFIALLIKSGVLSRLCKCS